MEQGQFALGNLTVDLDRLIVPPLITGDLAYLLLPLAHEVIQLVRPQEEGPQFPTISCGMVVESVFQHLKVVKCAFGSLGVCTKLMLRNIPSFLATTYILHNIC